MKCFVLRAPEDLEFLGKTYKRGQFCGEATSPVDDFREAFVIEENAIKNWQKSKLYNWLKFEFVPIQIHYKFSCEVSKLI